MASPLIFNPVAYETIFLHAARFGSYQVDGLLIGTARVVHETLPLFHGPGPFGPMLELAFVMAEDYATKKGLSILGYYHGPERLVRLDSLPDLTQAICNKLAANIPNSFVAIIDNTKIDAKPESLFLDFFFKSSSSWSRRETSVSFENEKSLELVNKSIATAFEEGYEYRLRDFSQHLDDPKNDWFNSDLRKLLVELK